MWFARSMSRRRSFRTRNFAISIREAMLAAIPLRQLPVERCVEQILAGVRKDKAIIAMPRFARFEWRLYRYFPRAASLLLRRRRSLFRDHRLSPAPSNGASKL